jgi:hypothetical protein
MDNPDVKSDGESSDTICFMARVDKKISLPGDLYNLITEKGKNILCIIPKDVKKIVLFPTNAESGIYAKINLKRENRLDDSFFISLREQITKFKLNTLFTTGICFEKVECYYEGIFEYYDNFPIEEFKHTLEKIKTVVSVTLKVLKPAS